MAGASAKSRCFNLSFCRNLQRTVVSIMFILLIGTENEMHVNCSFMQEAEAVMHNFKSRYNTTPAVDLVFVLDRSGSVTRSGWSSTINLVKNILDPFLVDQDHALAAIVTFSTSAVTEFNDLGINTTTALSATKCSVYRRLRHLISDVRLSGHTATYDALDQAFQILQASRLYAKKAVVLITDSSYNVGEHPRKMSIQIQSLIWDKKWNSNAYGPQVEIYAFGIENVTTAFLQSVVSDLPNHFAHFPNFGGFDQFTRSIPTGDNENRWIDADMSNCIHNCGQENSKCMCGVKLGQFACACKPGYELVGSVCKACQRGYYKEGYVPERCRRCPQNSTTSVVGTTNSSYCHPLPGHRRCPDLPNIEHGYKFYVSGDDIEEVANTGLDCKNVHDGNSCHYECETGYQLINGTKSLRCNTWGRWEGEIPYCKIVDCDVISESWTNASQVTLTYVNNTMSYGSIVSASCYPGLVPFGPTVWTCGENARWNGQSDFQCKEVPCGPLIPIEYADIVPADCATMKKPLGYECQMICHEGFQHMGPGNFTCSFEGRTFWKPRVGEEGEPRCHDIYGPLIDCPRDITLEPSSWENCTVIDYHRDEPTIFDNSGSARYRINGEPENDVFCVGQHILTYEAFDRANNTKKCQRTIIVNNKTFEVIRCPDDIVLPVIDLSRSRYVSWPDPIFHGRNNETLPYTCTRANGSEFQFGNHTVDCYPIAYPRSNCQFHIDIPVPACHLPYLDRMPFNGQVTCDSETVHAKRCSVKCHDGYELMSDTDTDTSEKYFCNWDGSWTLNKAWPQCYRSRRTKSAESINHLTVALDGSTCEQKREQIINGFIDKINTILKNGSGPCKPHCECSFRSVKLNCTGGRLRSKRSEDSLIGLTSTLDPLDPVTHAEIPTSLTFVIRAELDTSIESPVTKSSQKKIITALDDIYLILEKSSTFTWMADDMLITAIPQESDYPQFVDINCASDEVVHVEMESAACFTCSAGTFYLNGSCNPCPNDTYKDYEGGGPCKPCGGSRGTTSEGARNASECLDPCPAGYSSLTGYEPCTPCRVGTYQSEIKSNFCLQCPDNKTTSSNETTNIDDCYEPVSCEAYNKSCGSHGSCILRQGDIQCLCQAGFTGIECETNIDECEYSLCQNNGTCVDRINAYDCNCSASFTGVRCETEIDECLFFPCKNGGSCVDGFVSYSCVCPQGFMGADCEIDIDECASNPCRNGACHDGANSFNCSCLEGYTGHVCDRLIDFCINTTCYNGGKCIGFRGGSYCTCLERYTGANCESEVCTSSNPCQNNGTCTNDAISFRCMCPHGFIGDTCAREVSPDFDLVFLEPAITNFVKLRLKLNAMFWLRKVSVCMWMRSYDVQNYGTLWSYAADNNWLTADISKVLTASDYGNLKISVNGKTVVTNVSLNDGNWHHLCFVWSDQGEWILYVNGTRRREGRNLATGSHILSDGILILGQEQGSLGGSFDSHRSFIGELTQFSVFDEALSDALVFDLASIRSNKCKLAQGNVISWTDVLDSIYGNVTIRNASWCNDVNECSFKNLNNCTANDYCEDTLGSFICVKCETPDCRREEVSKTCAKNPCQNNGICRTDTDGYHCDCTSGYTGRHCENEMVRSTCDENSCLNGGTCDSLTGKCKCVTPWFGPGCYVRLNVTCAIQPCFNDGTCQDLEHGGYLCNCSHLDFAHGPDCETLSACRLSPCQSGAICVDADNAAGYKCECKPGFYGQNCESAADVCEKVDCKNGGTCLILEGQFKCKCTIDYKGTYCQNQRTKKVTIYNVQVKLEEQYHRTLPNNETFKNTFISEIHKIYRSVQLEIDIVSIWEGSVLINFDMKHTYFLDEDYASPKMMKKMLEDELKRGQLGIYKSTTEDFIFTTKDEPSNAAVYISVTIVAIIVTVAIFALIWFYLRRKRMSRAINKPLRVSNPTYQGDFPLATQNRNTVQESLYCDPVELLPYATSEDSDKDSDSGADGQTNKKKKKNWNLRQSIPLPPKPDEACGHSLAELNRATPPPPYSADCHAPIPPARETQKKSMASTNHHSYANQPRAEAASSCYFMPISDEEADLLTHQKNDRPISENPAFEPESAYLIPRHPAETPDAAEDIEMTYLAPTIDGDDAEATGGTMAKTNSAELSNGPDTLYAIRSLSCESSEANSHTTPLLLK